MENSVGMHEAMRIHRMRNINISMKMPDFSNCLNILKILSATSGGWQVFSASHLLFSYSFQTRLRVCCVWFNSMFHSLSVGSYSSSATSPVHWSFVMSSVSMLNSMKPALWNFVHFPNILCLSMSFIHSLAIFFLFFFPLFVVLQLLVSSLLLLTLVW